MAELEDLPPTTYPDGSVIGDFDAGTNPPEDPEILHRPHAFALMHGDSGAKVAYGELHWRVDTFKLQFKTSVIAVADHPDHSHTFGTHTHTFDHYHPHDHQHEIPPHTHPTGAHTHGTDSAGYSPHTHTTNSQSSSSTGSEVGGDSTTTDISAVNTGSPNTTTTDAAAGAVASGVKDTDGSTYGSGSLSHTVSGQITYCSGASQEAIGNITQQVPKYPTEDGTAMDPALNDTKYHELGEYGDVYLCWKVNLENVGGEVEKCWVQVGDPAGDGINEVPMGNETTDRRAAGDPKVGTGQPEGDDEGVFKIKLGTVNENDPVIQKVSSDVVWTPTVMDRIKI